MPLWTSAHYLRLQWCVMASTTHDDGQYKLYANTQTTLLARTMGVDRNMMGWRNEWINQISPYKQQLYILILSYPPLSCMHACCSLALLESVENSTGDCDGRCRHDDMTKQFSLFQRERIRNELYWYTVLLHNALYNCSAWEHISKSARMIDASSVNVVLQQQ